MTIEKVKSPFISLKDAIAKTADSPVMEYLFWGIPMGPSVTLLAARAKAGKTIACENLALALVDEDCNEFLGLNIATVDKVAILSFEEALVNRTQRQIKQTKAYTTVNNTKTPVDEKIFVLDADYYQFLADDKQRNELLTSLQALSPDVVFIDSLGRLAVGQIEDSSFSQQLMLYLRHIAFTLNCPIIVLHHTVKAKKSDSVELSSMAGSRVLAQESDAVFTIVEGYNPGERIIKPLAFRYSGDDNADITFRINEDCLVEYIGASNFADTSIIKKKKEDILHEYFQSNCTATLAELEQFITQEKLMSRSTLFEILKNFPVEKIDKGTYRYNKCSHHETTAKLLNINKPINSNSNVYI